MISTVAVAVASHASLRSATDTSTDVWNDTSIGIWHVAMVVVDPWLSDEHGVGHGGEAEAEHVGVLGAIGRGQDRPARARAQFSAFSTGSVSPAANGAQA